MSDAEKTHFSYTASENVVLYPDEGPKTYLARVDKLINMIRVAGIENIGGKSCM